MASKNRRITCKEAIRAIYIDFEGFRGSPPALLGELYQQDMKQHVLDPDYFDLLSPAKSGIPRGKHEGLSKGDPVEIVSRIVEQCRGEDRLLIAYGHREQTAIRKDYGIDVGDVYFNALPMVRSWVKKNFRSQPEDYSLKAVLQFLGYERRKEGKIQTKRLNDVRKGLESRGPLTGVQQAKWTNLLKHNRVDCQSLRDVVLLAASPRG